MSLDRELSVNLGLPAQPLTDDPKLFVELIKVYNAIKIIAAALDSHTGEPLYAEAGESISYGQTVGISTADGKVYKADDGVLMCIGWCKTAGGVVAGDSVSIQHFGLYPELPAASLTPGTRYYQSSTAGSIGLVGTAPTWGQVIGFAISDTQLYFLPNLKF